MPIYLLEKIGKFLERVIANRLVQHLKGVGPNLHEDQFRKGRSSTDAIKHVRALVESDTEQGRVVVAVSLNITNAFNTLPWEKLGESLKYLGWQLDGRWNFRDHFSRLADKVDRVSEALSRLMPNLGGPDDKMRSLYAHTVNLVALYETSMWAVEAVTTKFIRDILRRAQRRMAIRLTREYRTVSHAAASILASFAPMELLTRAHARTYERTKELQEYQLPPGSEVS
ncbi:uncharacterized protein [Anoplolepis gracilipes]|uniref:uncharacterized protein n=1 Tax=Anoplolepis gracilipes TaxID=354296 RepID=UPI003BA3403C